MSTLTIAALPLAETYVELLHSRSHWLFELTLELVSAPLAFFVGWLWRNGLLRHLHRDLHAMQHDVALPCGEPTLRGRLPQLAEQGRPSMTGGGAEQPREGHK